jgi:3'(2'), 5'-bisphosphate nucleotidase
LDFNSILEESKKLALEAGKQILEVYQGDIKITVKEDHSPLTEADQRSNEIIVTGLKAKFPQISILSEESVEDAGRHVNPYCFIVDPLDGTKEFIKRNGEFTVNIALSEHGKSIMGVIYVPVTGEMYYALNGQGSFYEVDGSKRKISVTQKTQDLVLMGSRSHQSDAFKAMVEQYKHKIKELQSAGSSLKGCLVAKGDADIYYRFGPTMEWDTAAMQCIVEEAGGIFKQMDHSRMRYNRKNSLNEKGFYAINCADNLFV